MVAIIKRRTLSTTGINISYYFNLPIFVTIHNQYSTTDIECMNNIRLPSIKCSSRFTSIVNVRAYADIDHKWILHIPHISIQSISLHPFSSHSSIPLCWERAVVKPHSGRQTLERLIETFRTEFIGKGSRNGRGYRAAAEATRRLVSQYFNQHHYNRSLSLGPLRRITDNH